MEELIVKEREIRNQLEELVNNSGLPALILKPIARDFYEQISQLEQTQYENAKKIIEENKEKEKEDGIQQN